MVRFFFISTSSISEVFLCVRGAPYCSVLSMADRLEVHEHRRSRSSRLEQAQGSFENCVLAAWLARCVERVAMRKRDKECPRRLNALGNLAK